MVCEHDEPPYTESTLKQADKEFELVKPFHVGNGQRPILPSKEGQESHMETEVYNSPDLDQRKFYENLISRSFAFEINSNICYNQADLQKDGALGVCFGTDHVLFGDFCIQLS